MFLSQRIRSMPESPIRKLAPHADGAKQAGRTVYHLNIGQPDIPTPDSFFAAVRGFKEKVLSYSPSHGLPGLRDAFSGYYRRQGIALDPQDIMVTMGGSEALFFAMIVTCDPGDQVLVPEPFYTSYALVAGATDVDLVPVPTRGEDGFHLPGREEIDQRISPRTRAILLSNPGNPTGTVYTRKEMEMVADLARENGLFIIADEVYREFVYEGEHLSFLQLPQVRGQVLLVDSISKRFSACGARIGSLACKDPQIMEQVLKVAQARLCVATIDQVGAIGLAQTPPTYFEEVKEEYRRRRDLTLSRLEAIPGVFCRQPEGAFYLLVRLPVADAEEFCTWLLRDFEYRGATVMLTPASGFYLTPGLGRDEVRLAYVLKEEDLVAALDVLKEGLRVYGKKGFK